MTTDLRAALRRVDQLCDLGYAEYDARYYAEIASLLRPHSDQEGVARIVRLADGGPSLRSQRFAYPHIQSYAAEVLRTLSQEDAAAPAAEVLSAQDALRVLLGALDDRTGAEDWLGAMVGQDRAVAVREAAGRWEP